MRQDITSTVYVHLVSGSLAGMGQSNLTMFGPSAPVTPSSSYMKQGELVGLLDPLHNPWFSPAVASPKGSCDTEILNRRNATRLGH